MSTNGALSPRWAPAIIDVDLWDEAGWFGVAFLGPTADRPLPRTGLLFGNAAPAAQIFTDLARRVGPRDVHEEITLAFVEHDAPGQGPGYTAIVGTRFATPTRRYRLADSGALAAFAASVARHGRYLLVPLVLGGDGNLRALYELAIEKKAIELRRAEAQGYGPLPESCLKRCSGPGGA